MKEVLGDISGIEALDCNELYFVNLTGVFNRIILVESLNKDVDVDCSLLI